MWAVLPGVVSVTVAETAQRWRQLRGPGRSTLFLRVREFQDQGPILMPQDDMPDWVKLNFSGPKDLRWRNLMGMSGLPDRLQDSRSGYAPSVSEGSWTRAPADNRAVRASQRMPTSSRSRNASTASLAGEDDSTV